MLETPIHAGFVSRRPTQAVYLPTGRTLDRSSDYRKHEAMALAAAPTLTRQTDALRRLLETNRHNGYAAMNKDYSNRSYNGTASAIGVPILLDGHAVGSLNLMCLRNTLDEAGVIDCFIAPLQQASAAIVAALAGLRSGVVQP